MIEVVKVVENTGRDNKDNITTIFYWLIINGKRFPPGLWFL